MTLSYGLAFDRFVVARTKELRLIAYFAGGQREFDDVLHESWLIARQPFEYLDLNSQQALSAGGVPGSSPARLALPYAQRLLARTMAHSES